MTENHQALITSRAVHATDKARLLAAQETGFTRHPLPLWVSGCRTKLSGLRLLTDLDARPVNCTPAYVEEQWMLGAYVVCPAARADPDTSAIIT